MALKNDAKFEEKLTCCLENDMGNVANFYQNTWKCKNWNFDGIFSPKVENAWSLKFAEMLGLMTMKSDTKIEEELTCRFKTYMKNFTHFDPSTRKSKQFVF